MATRSPPTWCVLSGSTAPPLLTTSPTHCLPHLSPPRTPLTPALATHALTHGDLAGALDHNVWVAVGVPLAVFVWLLWTLRTLGVPVPRLPRPRRAALGVAAVAMLVFTVVRNIPGVAAFEYLNSFT